MHLTRGLREYFDSRRKQVEEEEEEEEENSEWKVPREFLGDAPEARWDQTPLPTALSSKRVQSRPPTALVPHQSPPNSSGSASAPKRMPPNCARVPGPLQEL